MGFFDNFAEKARQEAEKAKQEEEKARQKLEEAKRAAEEEEKARQEAYDAKRAEKEARKAAESAKNRPTDATRTETDGSTVETAGRAFSYLAGGLLGGLAVDAALNISKKEKQQARDLAEIGQQKIDSIILTTADLKRDYEVVDIIYEFGQPTSGNLGEKMIIDTIEAQKLALKIAAIKVGADAVVGVRIADGGILESRLYGTAVKFK